VSATTPKRVTWLRQKTGPSGFSCAGQEILRRPFPSCPDFPTAHSGGRKFGRICQTLSKDYTYSTAERADLVEAIWRSLGIQSTMLVAFDFSSLVVLEILRRRLERAERVKTPDGPEIRGVFIFNGGLFTDGHSHPWYTTPLLRRLPTGARRRVPFGLFKRMPGIRKMWSKGYHVVSFRFD
jgi:pimeloyl-ACP methyl ester carboxylesterase